MGDLSGDGTLDLLAAGGNGSDDVLYFREGCQDLWVSKSGFPTMIADDNSLEYTITVSNKGPVYAHGVVVTDSVPGTVTFTGAEPPPSSVNGSECVFQLGSLAPGASTSLVVYTIVNADCSVSILSHATVQGQSSDANPDDNIAYAETPVLDSDGDSAPDFIDPDDDNDGLDDAAEAVAATDPKDPDSTFFLKLTMNPSTGGCILEFPSATGRVYRIECQTSLNHGEWSVIKENLPGSGNMLQVLDSNDFGRAYYRVRVEQP
ncbi:MAG: DUF11 domain-containing protein [Verrucomicrobiota bacterium]